jgi:restriction endonuclease S subunit
MTGEKRQMLTFVNFSNIGNWSASPSVALVSVFGASYNFKLRHILASARESVAIKDEKAYTRITIRQYGQGISARDTVFGNKIGTKKQYVASGGQLIVSGIDARNGSVGIVPDELAGAVVTNDFWLFDISEKVIPQYLALLLSSEIFRRHWQSRSSGTTNRQRINKNDFLEMEIPLPDISIQKKLIERYNHLTAQANRAKQKAADLEASMETVLFRELGLKVHRGQAMDSLDKRLRIVLFSALRDQWGMNDNMDLTIKALKSGKYPYHAIASKFNFIMRPWKRARGSNAFFNYVELNAVDKDYGIVKRTKLSINNAPSRATQIIRSGDLIIGMTRPYLKNFALVGAENDGDVCSSAFQVVKSCNGYDLRYLKYVLMSSISMSQFEALMTGALYPAVNQAQLGNLLVPFPDLAIQKKIANELSIMDKRIKVLKKTFSDLQGKAKQEFITNIYGSPP